MTVSLFGHRDANLDVAQLLENTLLQLIKEQAQINCFIGHIFHIKYPLYSCERGEDVIQ